MSDFPNIYRAALEIALDNGGINCTRSVGRQKREFEKWLAKQPQEPLPDIETLLNRALGKDADEMETTEARDDRQINLFA